MKEEIYKECERKYAALIAKYCESIRLFNVGDVVQILGGGIMQIERVEHISNITKNFPNADISGKN